MSNYTDEGIVASTGSVFWDPNGCIVTQYE